MILIFPRFEIVKTHRSAVANREREVSTREQALLEKEQRLFILINQKDQEIASLKQLIEEYQKNRLFSVRDVELAVKQAVVRREDELRVLVMSREEEVAASMKQREEEIMEAVQRRDAEICDAWVKREGEIRKEFEENYKSMQERMEWVTKRESELRDEEVRLEEMRENFEENVRKLEENTDTMKGMYIFCDFSYLKHCLSYAGRKDKNPLEEVKNLPHSQSRVMEATPIQRRRKLDTQPTPRPNPTPIRIVALQTPIVRPTLAALLPSAMKGVVLTATGETLVTPAPTELSKLFDSSPKVGLNFAKIFDFDEEKRRIDNPLEEDDANHSPPPSPSSRKERERAKERGKEKEETSENGSLSSTSTKPATTSTQSQTALPPTRIRRPSIRSSTRSRSITLPTSVSEPNALQHSSEFPPQPSKPLPHPHLRPSTSNSNLSSISRLTIIPPVSRTQPPPEYDFSDEENLPSPFLKRNDRVVVIPASGASSTTTSKLTPTPTPTPVPQSGLVTKPKRSGGFLLRAVAAANNAGRRRSVAVQPDHNNNDVEPETNTTTTDHAARPSLASARKASEEARKALSRP